jgi:NAD(P)-dependent dehydrogenase (short-subunit alcohol dehydrogenase family)
MFEGFSLAGKIAIVTGGASGYGAGICEVLAEATGETVMLSVISDKLSESIYLEVIESARRCASRCALATAGRCLRSPRARPCWRSSRPSSSSAISARPIS